MVLHPKLCGATQIELWLFFLRGHKVVKKIEVGLGGVGGRVRMNDQNMLYEILKNRCIKWDYQDQVL